MLVNETRPSTSSPIAPSTCLPLGVVTPSPSPSVHHQFGHQFGSFDHPPAGRAPTLLRNSFRSRLAAPGDRRACAPYCLGYALVGGGAVGGEVTHVLSEDAGRGQHDDLRRRLCARRERLLTQIG